MQLENDCRKREIDLLTSELLDLFREKFVGSVWQRWDGRLMLPHSTRSPVYVADDAPWLKEPLEVLTIEDTKEVTILAPAGSAKTLLGELYIYWIIENAPGMVYYVWPTDPEAMDMMEDRLMPTIKVNDTLSRRLPESPHKIKRDKVIFANMTLYALGANERNAQSKRVKYLIMEEPHTWEEGMMTAFRKRVEAVKNYRIVNLSTGSVAGDQTDEAWLQGDRREWNVACPDCGQYQPMRMTWLKWGNIIDDNGQPNFSLLRDQIYYQCSHCESKWKDLHDVREKLAKSGKYIVSNPNASKGRVSYHYNALSVPWIEWATLAEEYILAVNSARVGALEPLKDFVQKRLAEAWEDRPPDDVQEIQKSDYELGEPVAEERIRFLTVDVQKDHFWTVVRSWSNIGSRLMHCGRVDTYEDIKALQDRFNIKPKGVGIDSGFDTQTVYNQCLRYGWTALKGADRESFDHRMPDGGPTIKKIHSPVTRGDPGLGTRDQGRAYIPLFLYAAPACKDILLRYRSYPEAGWTIAKNTPEEYIYHLNGEVKKMRHHNITGRPIYEWVQLKRRPNHMLDCECMQITLAAIAGLVDRR